MELGAPDATGRRSPVATGETFEVPCDLVISAVGEQVDGEILTANGIELDRKGRPAFETNVPGVYAAGDATRGPATVVEGIADASKFADLVAGSAYEYEIPSSAIPQRRDCFARKGTLKMSSVNDHDRCLSCNVICQNCVDVCPNRANVSIRMEDGRRQVLHIDRMCNECGNCTTFCPYSSEPCKDKFTLYHTEEDFLDSKNAGFLSLGGGVVRVRLGDHVEDYDLNDPNNTLFDPIEDFIATVLNQYSYLL